MARFLFTIWPFDGHVNPFVPVAQCVRRAGHEVAFYTGASAAPALAGFTLFPFGRVAEHQAWATVMRAEASAAKGRSTLGALRAFRDWLAGSTRDQVADLEPIVRSWRPDVLVTETAMWGPFLVLWEKTRTPVAIASTLLGCLIPGPESPLPGSAFPTHTALGRLLARAARSATDVLATPMRRDLDRLRAEHGLPPMGTSVTAFTARLPLYLVPSLPDLDGSRRDLPPNVHYVGPCVWSKPTHTPAHAWLDALPSNQPWIHVTEGTLQYREPFLLRAAARGLAGRPCQVLLTSGRHRDPATLGLGPLAPNVRLEQWVPHADLLPRCSVFVTTGGAGSVMAALQVGVPLIVVPTLWDKADNARRVVDAGVGLRLDPGQCTPVRLRAAVEHVLADARFRTNARRLAAQLAAAPGPRGAAELLEDLAARAATSPDPSGASGAPAVGRGGIA